MEAAKAAQVYMLQEQQQTSLQTNAPAPIPTETQQISSSPNLASHTEFGHPDLQKELLVQQREQQRLQEDDSSLVLY